MSYKTGIYTKTPQTKEVGGHVVKVVGWGETMNGNKYWLAANSWGEQVILLNKFSQLQFYILVGEKRLLLDEPR
jgi:hypothetical protein